MTTILAGIDVSKAALFLHVAGRDCTVGNDRNGYRKID